MCARVRACACVIFKTYESQCVVVTSAIYNKVQRECMYIYITKMDFIRISRVKI